MESAESRSGGLLSAGAIWKSPGSLNLLARRTNPIFNYTQLPNTHFNRNCNAKPSSLILSLRARNCSRRLMGDCCERIPPGSACVSRAWRLRLAIANFLARISYALQLSPSRKVRFGGTPKPGTRDACATRKRTRTAHSAATTDILVERRGNLFTLAR
jgi:hypothetical protein